MQLVVGALIFAIGCFFGAWMLATGEAMQEKKRQESAKGRIEEMIAQALENASENRNQ